MPDPATADVVTDTADNERAYLTLRDKAYRVLARREHSAWELRRKLQSAGEPQMIERVLAELAECGAQSDERFAEHRARWRYQTGRGPLKLRGELAEHQIEETLIACVMSAYDTKWHNLATEVRRRKFGESAPASYREWAKQARFLQQRGFATTQIEPYAG